MPNQRNETESQQAGNRGPGPSGVNGEDKSQNKSTLLSQAKTAAGDIYETVADKATTTIDEQKAGLTGKLTGVADTVRRVSGTLHDTEADNPVSGYAARYTDTAAQKLDSVAKYFDGADLKDIARDLESYARRNPAIFLGGAFAIGIMAARFLKSSPPSDIAATAASKPSKSLAAPADSRNTQTAGASSGGI